MRIRFPEILEEKKISVYRLSQLTGIPDTTMYRWKGNKGAVKFVNGPYMERIRKALGLTSTDDLLAFTGDTAFSKRKRKKGYTPRKRS